MSKAPQPTATRQNLWHALTATAALAITFPAFAQATKVLDVMATAQTRSVETMGDAADDIAIWVNANDLPHSRIIGTDKKAGVIVYDLSGESIQSILVGRINNVDLHAGFEINGKPRVLVAGSDRDNNAARFWLVDEDLGTLIDAPGTRVDVGLPEPYGLCLGQYNGKTYVITSDRTSGAVQHEITIRDGKLHATLVRRFESTGEIEGLVVDDTLGVLYLGEENTGLWRVPIDPTIPLGRTSADPANPVLLSLANAAKDADRAKVDALVMVSRVGPGFPIMPDVEGLAIANSGNGGVLIASSQGDSTFAVFDRALTNQYRGSFRIVGSKTVDGVEETDGIDVAVTNMGASYPFGVFVAQDGKVEGRGQNFKLVPWEHIARAFTPPLPIGGQ